MQLSNFNDKRLDAKYAHEPSSLKIAVFANNIKKSTRILASVDKNECYYDEYFIATKDSTFSDIMDATACIRRNRQWRRTGANTYLFEESIDAIRNVYGTRGDAIREKRFEILSQVFSEIEKNPALSGAFSARGISGDQISPRMRLQLRDVVNNERSKQSETDLQYNISIGYSEMSQLRLAVERENISGANVYQVMITIPDVCSYSISYSDTESNKKSNSPSNKNILGRSQAPAFSYQQQKKEIDQNFKDIRINLDARDKRVIDIVALLHKSSPLEFLCDKADDFRERSSLRLRNLPVDAAMDQICRIYPGVTWEYRKTGVLLVRSAKNLLSHK